jgi:RNA polymerase sigma factor (sigma-70 family)
MGARVVAADPLATGTAFPYGGDRMADERAEGDTHSRLGVLRDTLGRGDHRAALRLLMTEHGSAVFGYCARVLGDSTLGADVHQQVFEEAYRDLGTLKRPEHARSWLFGIAHHRCLDAVKARRRAEKRFAQGDDTIGEIADEPRDPTEGVDRKVVARALDECIRTISAESRIAVLLRLQEGLSYTEMERMCREKATTLQARVTRALPLLRRCLKGKGVEA